MYKEEETTEVGMSEQTTSHEGESRYSYADYISMGGRIDEENYTRVIQMAQDEAGASAVTKFTLFQTATIAGTSDISLEAIHAETGINPVCIYSILRSDKIPREVRDHHSQMNDQQLLVESLRMLGAHSAIDAIIAKHPHITFI